MCGAILGLCFGCTEVVQPQGSYQKEWCLKRAFRAKYELPKWKKDRDEPVRRMPTDVGKKA